ncbi:MAG: sugar isomerase domain-containing protein [Bacteroidetes bacterium]|nr:sugar isomerase domain-containing protein [Bacteroidota bacterium]
MSAYTHTYLSHCKVITDAIALQEAAICEAASLFHRTILAGRMVHLFGSGHSRIMVEEMWPRYGSFPGFNPIVELAVSFHNLVVGANGQRQAMFLENVSGYAAQILRNFDIAAIDSALLISSSGTSTVAVEMAEIFCAQGVKVVGIVSKRHSDTSASKRADGRRLGDFCHILLDSGAPVGDAMVQVEGLDTPVAPGSTIGSCMLVNCIKAELAAMLTAAGQPPTVLTAANVVSAERSQQLFQSAYDEHAHRLARLYERVGQS